jgi:glycosyltransferase involved in cell wall biosynthesis
MTGMISIISPAYNVEKCIEKCIKSTIDQTYKNFEHIIIDDGSTDQTNSVISKYAKIDPRVKIITSSRSGVTSARKAGIEKAEGDYLYFLDSDDYLSETSLVDLWNKAITDNTEIIVGGYTEVGLSGEIVNYLTDSENIITSDEYISQILKSENQGLCGKLFRKEIFGKNISYPFNLSYGEDFNILIQLVSFTNRISRISKSVFFYVRRNNSLTNSNANRLNYLYYDRALFLNSIIDKLQVNQNVKEELILEVIWNLYPCIRYNDYKSESDSVRNVFKVRFAENKIRREINEKKWNKWLYINIYLNAPFLLRFYNTIAKIKNLL